MKKMANGFGVMSIIIFSFGIYSNLFSSEPIELWPAIEPFYSDYFRVSQVHELYFELCGNPHGQPVFVLHGGPGGSVSPNMRRFFNPDKFLIVLYDQRGCGKSRPFADTRENTTQFLVQDIEQLRTYLKLDKIILFGGSWGSTLALAYAETYPANVYGMVLRGIFTATKEEIDHFYHGGVKPFFPETYQKLVEGLTSAERNSLPKTLLHFIESKDEEKTKKYVKAWAGYEIKLSVLEISDEQVEGILKDFDATAFSLLENYYMANGCFLKEGQLIQEANKIKDIPLIMVNGRYDMICPPITAYKLHQILPKSQLNIVEGAGHWMGDKPIEQALLRAMREFEE
jgi:proline iminopeptidase